MRIGIDIRELEKGKFTGIGRYLRHFLEYVGENDKENEYILFGNQKTEYSDAFRNQKLEIIKENITTIWDQILLPIAIKRARVDVFLTPYFKAPLFCPSKLVVIINDLIPLLVDEYRSRRYFLRRIYFKCLTKITVKRADHLMTISHCTKKDLMRIFKVPEEKIDVMTLAVEDVYRIINEGLEESSLKYGITEKFIFYAGNFKPHKNVNMLIEAYVKLPKNIQDEYKLVIGGKKDENCLRLKESVCEKSIDERVIFTDYIEEGELPHLYNAASIFVFPSLYEGFGLPALEAMACGTPVITSNVSSLPEIAGDAAILINPHNVCEIADAINRILIDKSLQDSLIQKGLDRAREFTKEKMSKQILAVINKVCLK